MEKTSTLGIEFIHPQQMEPQQLPIKPKGFGQRHVQVFMLFLCILISYSLRVNLSIGIVAMVDNSSNPDFQEFNWSESIRSLLLSSFFWGYIFSNIPASQVAQRFGAKYPLAIALCACTILTLLSPLAAGYGYQYLIGVRVLLGLAQGFLTPCVHTLLPHWVHPSERGFQSTFTYSGTQMGTALMLASGGFIADSKIGWPGIFYISGGLTGVWTIAWICLGVESPSVCNSISAEEKAYIESTEGYATPHEKMSVPWCSILKSKAFWAILVAHCAHNWGFWTLLTEIPTYMKEVLQFDIQSDSLLSAMPYFVMWILCLVFSQISDLLSNRNILSVSNCRKLFNTIGLWGPVLPMIALGYIGKDDAKLAVFLLTLAVALNAAIFVAFMINHMDVSPNFAGTMMGMTNGISQVMSLLGPLFVGVIVTGDDSDTAQWRIVFYVAAGFFIVGNLIYIIFGTGRIQPWNEAKTKNQHAMEP